MVSKEGEGDYCTLKRTPKGDSLEARDNRAAGLVIQEVTLASVRPLEVLVAIPEPRILDCPKYTPGEID